MKLAHTLQTLLALFVTAVSGGTLGAQHLLFQIPHPGGADELADADFDLNGDGFGDVLYGGRVYSGASGELLLDVTAVVGTSNVDVEVFRDLGLAYDGVPDFMALTQNPIYGPTLYAISGADGSLVTQVPFATFGDFGNFLRNVGDADGDGVEDAIAGTTWFEGPCNYEMASVAFLSGGKGDLVAWYMTTNGLNGSYEWGVRLGDINGDGRQNFGIRKSCGGGQWSYSATPTGPVNALYYLGFTTYYEQEKLGAVGDLDGDGRDDYGVFAPQGATPRRVSVVSGTDGLTRLRTFPVDADRVIGPGDVDCDGVPDVLVTGSMGWELTRLFSGRDSRELWIAPQRARYVRRVGDIDGDGRADLGLQMSNFVQIWSTASLGSRACKQTRPGRAPRGVVDR